MENNVKTIAFPAISTGVYGYPKQQATEIALKVMRQYEQQFDEIIACCFNKADYQRYQALLAK